MGSPGTTGQCGMAVAKTMQEGDTAAVAMPATCKLQSVYHERGVTP